MRATLAVLIGCFAPAFGAEAWAVPTFESLGFYYNQATPGRSCAVRYRAAGSGPWRDGYPPVYDPREKQWRGSLVGLAPDTAYDIQLDCPARVEFQARTLSDQFPIGRTTSLPGGVTDQPLTIRDSGSPTGWHLVTPRPARDSPATCSTCRTATSSSRPTT